VGDRRFVATVPALGDKDCMIGDASCEAMIAVSGDTDCVIGEIVFEPPAAVTGDGLSSSSAAAAALLTGRTCDFGGVPEKRKQYTSRAHFPNTTWLMLAK